MNLIPFDGDLDETPTGLVPFDGELDDDSSWLDKGKGALQTAGGMLSPMVSSIAGGFAGMGSLMQGEGIDKAVERQNRVTESNFGLGLYKPTSKKGQEYTENVGNALQYPVTKMGDAGAFIGKPIGLENELRSMAEFGTSAAMELVEPTAVFMGAKGAARATARALDPVKKPSGTVGSIREQQGAIKGLEADVTFPDGRTDTGRAIDNMAQDLTTGQYSPVDFPPNNAFPGMAETLSGMGGKERAGNAQTVVDQRRAQMEFEVKRQAALDFNAAERKRLENAPTKSAEQQARMAQLEQERLAIQSKQMESMYQTEIDDTPYVLPDTNQVIAPQYGAMQGAGRMDEHGMPIRADLSMEAQNLENPLQRNLFGDELGSKGLPESRYSLTAAMDNMSRESRTAAIEQTKWGREMPADADLRAAVAEASGDNLKGFNARTRKQGGGLLIGNKKVEIVKTEDGFSARVDGKEVGYLRSNLTPEQRAQLGETANVDIVKVQDEFKSKGVGKALYQAWTEANDGKVAPSGKTSKDAWKVWKRDNPTAVDEFVKQEANRIATGADERMVLGNITDPQIRERVSSFNARTRGQGGAIDPDVFLKDFPNFVASTIKDAAGKLKVLYHGTSKDVNFSDIKTGATGAWLTDSPKGASEYAKENDSQKLKYNADTRRSDELNTAARVMPVYANVTNPYTLSPEDLAGYRRAENYTKFQRELTAKAKAAGHDGIDWGDGIYTVFNPDQIKSALSPAFVKSQKKQSGVILIDPTEVNKAENNQVQRDNTIPLNPDVEEVLSKARDEKDGKQWTYVQSGATSVAMKSGSSAILAAGRIVQNALKRADLAIRNNIFPAEASLRKLSRQEITDLSTLLKDEMFNGQRYDGDILAKNLSVKQLEAYRNMRDLFDKTLDVQNEARLAKGQAPISPVEAYLSSRWEGDFRRPVYDANGNLVWYLASRTKRGLETQSAELKKQFPDLMIDPKKDHTVTLGRGKNELQSMYTTMIDLLGRDDPAIAKIQKAIEEQTIAQGEAALGQEKHFEKKMNVRGFTGDRPGKSGSSEAIAMFQQQIQYAKNAFKWSEMQLAADDIKGIVSDPVLQDKQPNNVKYIREYFKNAIGMGESQVTRAVGDTLRSGLGVSPQMIDNGVGNLKSFFILQKLAMSPGYALANMIQAGNVIPYLGNLMDQGYRGNPAVAVLVGFPAGMMMGVAHMLKATGGEYIDRLPNQFFKDAFQYAEDNGVTARSVYDEAPLETGFSVGARIAKGFGRTMTLPETFVRSTAFMTYAQMLKDSGKFKDNGALFQKAEELVNKSMVDYRETERPLMFAKAGTLGNVANTLQTYPMSFYNQWAYMLKEATRGNITGLLALAGFQYLVAGAMGMPGFQDTDDIYKYIRDNLVKTETYNKMANSPFLSDPKLWMMENLGNASVYGVLSDQTGVGMTSRVAAPSLGAMGQSPIGPITDVAKQVGALGSAVLDPTNKGKWAQSAMLSFPVGLQGLLETSSIMEGYTYNINPKTGEKVFVKASDLADRSGTYARTPEEETQRAWGVRSQKEVVTRDVAYATRLANQTLSKKSGELGSKIYDAARRGDKEKTKELTTLYYDLTGKEFPEASLNREIYEEFYTDVQKNYEKADTPRQLMNAAKMKKLLESR